MLDKGKSDSRMEILKILRKGKCSIEELSGKMDITPTAIRQHISILEKDSLVEKEAMREKTGRPRYLYNLTEAAESYFPKQYGLLSEMIIEEIAESEGEERLRRLFVSISEKFYNANESLFGGKNLEERVQALMVFLNEKGAEAVLSQTDDAYIIEEYNCAFKTISGRFPAICDICTHFIHLCLGQKVEMERKMNKGDDCCLYSIRK